VRPRIAFFGTDPLAGPILAEFERAGIALSLIVAGADKLDRKKNPVPPTEKQWALERSVSVLQPQKIDAAFIDSLAAKQWDLFIVASYGKILPKRLLDIPKRGVINVHPSLLPLLRGPSPIRSAILRDMKETGVTIMQMDAGLDTGAMLLVEKLPIAADDTTASLHDKLATLGGRLIVEALELAACGGLQAVPQPAEGVSYAHKIDKQEATVDWTQPADVIARRIRAFNPFPVAVTSLQGESIKLWCCEIDSASRLSGKAPGTILSASEDGIDVQCGSGVLRLIELQRAGGKRLAAADFLRGFALPVGAVLGAA
jgi:methionyl-tRNA formyltransferase